MSVWILVAPWTATHLLCCLCMCGVWWCPGSRWCQCPLQIMLYLDVLTSYQTGGFGEKFGFFSVEMLRSNNVMTFLSILYPSCHRYLALFYTEQHKWNCLTGASFYNLLVYSNAIKYFQSQLRNCLNLKSA